jgi:hypothetical protein
MRQRLAVVLLVLPGAGFIFLFLAVALTITALQSVGILGFGREPGFTWEFWRRSSSPVPRLIPVLGQGRHRQRFRHAPAGLSTGAVPAAPAGRRASSDRS